MKLNRVTDRIWVYPFERERDRPILGYIRGDKWSLAVDAGHSAAHTEEFYTALTEAGLPLPAVTVLTHWHWDHTFGMHAIHGLSLAGQRTNEYLAAFREKLSREGLDVFLNLDPSIRLEYAGDRPVVITLADLVFTDEMELDLGGATARLLHSEAPHTDDSTLIFIPEEKVLFLGDAAGGTFPTWEKDPVLCGKLAKTIASLEADLVLESHTEEQTREEMLKDLLDEVQR